MSISIISLYIKIVILCSISYILFLIKVIAARSYQISNINIFNLYVLSEFNNNNKSNIKYLPTKSFRGSSLTKLYIYIYIYKIYEETE